ncbi:hypothetical protein [Bradyrhizobium cenepequi]
MPAILVLVARELVDADQTYWSRNAHDPISNADKSTVAIRATVGDLPLLDYSVCFDSSVASAARYALVEQQINKLAHGPQND